MAGSARATGQGIEVEAFGANIDVSRVTRGTPLRTFHDRTSVDGKAGFGSDTGLTARGGAVANLAAVLAVGDHTIHSAGSCVGRDLAGCLITGIVIVE